MEEFSYNTIYSTGWRRINREEGENDQKMVYELMQKASGSFSPLINKQKTDNAPAVSKKAVEPATTAMVFEDTQYAENQKAIMDKINQLQIELSAMKQLLSNIHSNTEMIKAPSPKNTFGSKFSRLFK